MKIIPHFLFTIIKQSSLKKGFLSAYQPAPPNSRHRRTVTFRHPPIQPAPPNYCRHRRTAGTAEHVYRHRRTCRHLPISKPFCEPPNNSNNPPNSRHRLNSRTKSAEQPAPPNSRLPPIWPGTDRISRHRPNSRLPPNSRHRRTAGTAEQPAPPNSRHRRKTTIPKVIIGELI